MLEQVLITHSHEDHVRRVCDLVALYNCDVYISRKEAEYYCPNLHYFEDEDILNKGISFPYILCFARSVYGVCEIKKYLFLNCT